MLLVKLIGIQMVELRAKAGCSIGSIVHQPMSYSLRQRYKTAWDCSSSRHLQQRWQLPAHGPQGLHGP